MSPETLGFIVPPDEILSIFEELAMSDDTQPTPVSDDLINKNVAVAMVHEEEGGLRSIAPAHVGRVAAIGGETGHVHLDWRVRPVSTNVTLIVPERFYAPVVFDSEYPNVTQRVAVRSLFYVLRQPAQS